MWPWYIVHVQVLVIGYSNTLIKNFMFTYLGKINVVTNYPYPETLQNAAHSMNGN